MANNVLTMHFEYQIFIKKIYIPKSKAIIVYCLKSVYYDTKFTVLFVSLILPTAVALYHSVCESLCAHATKSNAHYKSVTRVHGNFRILHPLKT